MVFPFFVSFHFSPSLPSFIPCPVLLARSFTSAWAPWYLPPFTPFQYALCPFTEHQAHKSIHCSLAPSPVNECVEQTGSSFLVASLLVFSSWPSHVLRFWRTHSRSPHHQLPHVMQASFLSSSLLGSSILDKCILSYPKGHIKIKGFHSQRKCQTCT